MDVRQGSYSAQFFFLPKFTRIATPREGEKNYAEKSKSSVVAEFNRVQRENERPTCGSTAAVEWLKKHRPKVALHPSMTDYCDTCKYLKEQLSRNQAILNRQQQSGSTSGAELRTLESAKRNLEEELAQHKDTATKARESIIRLQQRDASHSGLSSSDLPMSPDHLRVRERSCGVHNTVSP